MKALLKAYQFQINMCCNQKKKKKVELKPKMQHWKAESEDIYIKA